MMHFLASRRLSAYLDGELPPWQTLALERHLGQCRACAGHLEALRGVQTAIQNSPRSAPPGEGWARLREQMGAPAPSWRHGAPPPLVPRRRRLMVGAAAAFAIVAGASAYLTLAPRPSPREAHAAPLLTAADLAEGEPISLSPSIELVLAARQGGRAAAGDDR